MQRPALGDKLKFLKYNIQLQIKQPTENLFGEFTSLMLEKMQANWFQYD